MTVAGHAGARESALYRRRLIGDLRSRLRCVVGGCALGRRQVLAAWELEAHGWAGQRSPGPHARSWVLCTAPGARLDYGYVVKVGATNPGLLLIAAGATLLAGHALISSPAMNAVTVTPLCSPSWLRVSSSA